MRFNYLFAFILLTFLMVNVSSQAYPIGEDFDLNVICFSNGYCSAIAVCNATVFYPNNTLLIDNVAMTNNINYYNFTINGSLLNTLGEYDVSGFCTDAGSSQEIDFSFEITLSGEQTFSTIIVSDIVLLLVMFSLMFLMTLKYKEVDFDKWDKNIIKNHKNYGQTFVSSIFITLFKNSFIWLYFTGWICVLILKDIVYRFNTPEIYSYFTLVANIYSLGLVLVTAFFIGMAISYFKGVLEILAENNWGLGNEE